VNYYTKVSAELPLIVTEDEYKELLHALGEDGDDNHGFSMDFDEPRKRLFIKAEENGDWEQLSDEFLILLGQRIAFNELNFLEFGVSYDADRVVPQSCGGTAFRVYPNGEIRECRKAWD